MSGLSNKSVSFSVSGQTSTPNNRNVAYNKNYNQSSRIKYDKKNGYTNISYDRSTVILRKGKVKVIKGDTSHEIFNCEPKIIAPR